MIAWLKAAPYIAIALLIGAVGWFWWSADNAKAERDAARRELELAVEVNKTNTRTIEELRKWKKFSDDYMLELSNAIARLATASEETTDAIKDLQTSDEEVRKYLGIPIPASLKCVLNRTKDCGGNKDDVPVSK